MHERQLCKLHELEQYYSLPDLANMHDGLDVIDALAAKVHAANQHRAGK